MSYTRIESLLKEHMGLDSHTVGSSTIERAVQQRMKVTGQHDNATDYYKILLQSHDELLALIEEVIIPETWFFRDMRPFSALHQYISREWLVNRKDRILRILSIPCSTGEEPYSIAMVLEELGLGAKSCHIDAVDISSENLVKAKRAMYRRNSFRGDELSFRDRHFTPQGDGFLLHAAIRERVHFTKANMLSTDFLQSHEAYDVVFCRNLLIYFDRPTQDRALGVLRRLLKPQGILFIGHAEAGLFLNSWHASSHYPSAFAFRLFNEDPTAENPRETKPERRRSLKASPAKQVRQRPPLSRSRAPTSTKPAPEKVEATPLASAADTLDEVLQLANSGRLAEAARLCERHIHTDGPSATAFYLFGLIREAAGDSSQAEIFWRKTIYLEPKHIEALTHLALILERNGEAQEAKRLRQRAERASARQITEA